MTSLECSESLRGLLDTSGDGIQSGLVPTASRHLCTLRLEFEEVSTGAQHRLFGNLVSCQGSLFMRMPPEHAEATIKALTRDCRHVSMRMPSRAHFLHSSLRILTDPVAGSRSWMLELTFETSAHYPRRSRATVVDVCKKGLQQVAARERLERPANSWLIQVPAQRRAPPKRPRSFLLWRISGAFI